MPWQPTSIYRPDRALKTAADTVQVETDAGPGYLKALGNHGGPHLLAAEWVATHLARWLGLPTFDFALVQVAEDDEIVFLNGQRAQAGPAFITRTESGWTWGGSSGELELLLNPDDIPRLVVFDTWTRNCDRHPPDLSHRLPNRNNVFFSNEDAPADRAQLMAMDHTHCFDCGRDLNGKIDHIDHVKDERIFGLFPEFGPYVEANWRVVDETVGALTEINLGWVATLVETIPNEWQVSSDGRSALARLICRRAEYTAETIGAHLRSALELSLSSEDSEP